MSCRFSTNDNTKDNDEKLQAPSIDWPLVDVWSIGCIFAELITGNPLFPGIDHIDQFHKIIQMLGSPGDSFLAALPNNVRNYLDEYFPRYQAAPFERHFPNECFPPDELRYEALTGEKCC